jgi:NADH-quinone oxidoreductase subunit J
LFSDYVAIFELTAALLITATIGALVLAYRERLGEHRTQKELSEDRFRSGQDPGPLPAPGTYARHNAVDTPALLPDGSLASNSVPSPMIARGTVRPIDIAAAEEVRQIAEGKES